MLWADGILHCSANAIGLVRAQTDRQATMNALLSVSEQPELNLARREGNPIQAQRSVPHVSESVWKGCMFPRPYSLGRAHAFTRNPSKPFLRHKVFGYKDSTARSVYVTKHPFPEFRPYPKLKLNKSKSFFANFELRGNGPCLSIR